MKIPSVIVIANNVFQEVIRDRVLYVLGFYTFLMLMAVWVLPELAIGSEGKILLDLGIAAIGLLSLIVALFVGTNIFNKEIDKRTIYVLLAKPLSRVEIVIGKHLGLSAVMATLISLMGLIDFAILFWQKISYPLGTVLVALSYMLLELCLICAVAIASGVFTTSLMALLITFAVYLMGHLSRDLVIFSALVPNAAFQTIARVFYLLVPDLSRLNLKNEAVYGLLPDVGTLTVNAGYGLIYMLLLLLLATAIFSQREF